MVKKLLLLSFLISNIAFSQEEVPFSIRFQDYVQGDLTFIANNCVNRKNANEAYNKTSDNAKLNDEFEMAYIDIDNDDATFSSSTATLVPNQNASQLVYAGLYWSATYKSKTGLKKNESFSSEGEREGAINEIKIKIPAQNNYQTISGNVLFDGYLNEKHKNNSPYVCYYDLTEMVKSNPYGDYTVANIKATQGYLEGGVAGGWIIYFVYSDAKATKKYITLYDGFAHIYNKPVDINLSQFLTPKTGEIHPKIVLAALEGDLNLDGDNVRIKSAINNKYFPIASKNRIGSNFFNSQISIENEAFITRNPSSLNTLGFDALLLSLNNVKNKIITNSATNTQLKIATNGDKVYLFSVGFTVEVDEVFFEKNRKYKPEEKNTLTVMNSELQKETEEKNTKESIKVVVKTIPNTTSTQIRNENAPQTIVKGPFTLKLDPKIVRIPKDIRKLSVKSNLKHGYYIVANVFSVESNKTKYIEFLKENNITANSLINPENNFHYVYLKYFENIEEAQKAYDNNVNNTFFDEYWILEVNQ